MHRVHRFKKFRLFFSLLSGLDDVKIAVMLTRISTCTSVNLEPKVLRILANMRVDLEIIRVEAQNLRTIAT